MSDVINSLPSFPQEEGDSIRNFAYICKLLSRGSRLKMLLLLLKSQTPMCVSDIADSVKISHPLASMNLAPLHAAGILERQPLGKKTFYTVTQPYQQLLSDALSDEQVIARVSQIASRLSRAAIKYGWTTDEG